MVEISEDKGFNKAHFDENVKASEDFFLFANGGWMKSNPIPPEYPSWNTFLDLHTKNQERLREMLNGLEEKKKAGTALTDDEEKVATFYAASMDEEAVEAAGVAPLQPAFDCCEKARDPLTRAYVLAELQAKYDTCGFFGICAETDCKDADLTIC